MTDKHQVFRDGNPVSPILDDRNQAFAGLLKHQGQSVDYATRYGGYSFETVAAQDDLEVQG